MHIPILILYLSLPFPKASHSDKDTSTQCEIALRTFLTRVCLHRLSTSGETPTETCRLLGQTPSHHICLSDAAKREGVDLNSCQILVMDLDKTQTKLDAMCLAAPGARLIRSETVPVLSKPDGLPTINNSPKSASQSTGQVDPNRSRLPRRNSLQKLLEDAPPPFLVRHDAVPPDLSAWTKIKRRDSDDTMRRRDSDDRVEISQIDHGNDSYSTFLKKHIHLFVLFTIFILILIVIYKYKERSNTFMSYPLIKNQNMIEEL